MSNYYVYILTNKTKTVLYIGVTNNLFRRVEEHRLGLVEGFTKKYKTKTLVYAQAFNSPLEAIVAEKKLKGWTRQKKENLIASVNPEWQDLNVG